MNYKFLTNIILVFFIIFLFSFSEDKYNVIREIKTMDKIHSEFLMPFTETKENNDITTTKDLSTTEKENNSIKSTVEDSTVSNYVKDNEKNSDNNVDNLESDYLQNTKIKEISNSNFNYLNIKKELTLKPTLKKISSDDTNNIELEEKKKEFLKKDEKFEEINDRTNRVTALGSAMGAIDLGSTPAKKIRLGAGVGNASSSQAVAVGVGYAPTENLRFNTKFSSSTNSVNNNSISIGASYDLDI